MLEEKDLQAIAQLMQGMEDRIDQKLAQQKKEIMQEVGVLIENEVTPRFNLLAEELDAIKERLPAPDILEQIQEELDIQHAVVKRHTKEIQALKKAQ